MGRREDLLDAAITVLGEGGMRALTHRAVDAAAGLPPGSTSNYFRTRDTLLTAVVERFVDRERAASEEIAGRRPPGTHEELIEALVDLARGQTGRHRTLALARYVILAEAAIHPPLRAALLAGGARVRAYFLNWLAVAGSVDPERDAPPIMNHFTGLVLHQLAAPDPAFDPTAEITALVTAVLRPR
ncbi:TetR/AcrR family transcriptional regulator [Luedemannella helvata]|uniref:TetR/AcrR family transcriptional regulator n=1 Tax=Luedemannella helvata TaxID=349315 RepID=A0ABN2L5U8_9ACTN